MTGFSLDSILRRPRDFVGNRFVYAVVSQRAGGLSIGINMNPDQQCNFRCVYCEVRRSEKNKGRTLDVAVMSRELAGMLVQLQLGMFHQLPAFSGLPRELLALKNVALSGDGEPTLCRDFTRVAQAVLKIREMPQLPAFKLVLITNGTELHRPVVQEGLRLFGPADEVWVKLDAGGTGHMNRINRTDVAIGQVLANIEAVGKWRPVIIQSVFCSIDGREPDPGEIEAYIQRLAGLKNAGAKIPLVQIYSAARTPAEPGCSHLQLKQLSVIARRIREATGIKAEVF